MPKAVIENIDEFKVFLGGQPLCKWAAQKKLEIAMGMHSDGKRASIHPPPPKHDNSELAEALSSMA